MNSAYTFVLYALDVAPFWVALVVGILGYVLSIVARQYFPSQNDKNESLVWVEGGYWCPRGLDLRSQIHISVKVLNT